MEHEKIRASEKHYNKGLILAQCSISIPIENALKPLVF